MKILVTGHLGFIFSNFMRIAWQSKIGNHQLVGIDKATKPYHLERINDGLFKSYIADIAQPDVLNRIFEIEKPDYVIHGAAESHVDDAEKDILPFLNTNILGTQHVVNACLQHKVKKLVHISTDEIYGQQLDINNPGWIEDDPLKPRNNYAASKASAEHIVKAAGYTHGLNYNITRSCNVYGPRQKKENLIPHIINSILNNISIHLHGNGKNFRQYIYVDEVCHAIMMVLLYGVNQEIYNIGNNNILSNYNMVNYIGQLMQKPYHIDFITDRKCHDFGYKVSYNKLLKLQNDFGNIYKSKINLKQGLIKTIDYYLINNIKYYQELVRYK